MPLPPTTPASWPRIVPPVVASRRARPAAARLALVALLASLAGHAVPARAQPVAGADAPAGSGDELRARAADSAAVLHRARDAQAAFERRRRQLLPVLWGGGQGRCDVPIGRFCYWYDEDAPDGPEEPPRIAAERRKLLALLHDAAAALPGDGWLAGQRVRYHLEGNEPDSALAAASACAGEAVACGTLVGLALHLRGDAAAADSAFAAAEAAMPEAERCAWTDISLLLAGERRERYERLPCAARDSVARRYWWLATPFFARGANDRRNEHRARLVLSRLHAESRTPYTELWRGDLHELLVRYGWPHRWSRRELPSAYAGEASIVGHDPSPAYRFAAADRLLDDPYAASAEDWPLRDPKAVDRYAPAFARRLHDLPATAAALRRGDSLLVVAAWRAPPDSVVERVGRALVVALARENAPPVLVADRLRAPAGGRTVMLPARPHLLSLEMLGDSGQAARARLAVRPPTLSDGFGISDLLLFDDAAASADPSDAAADPHASASLDRVLAATLGADEVAAPRRLGVYWELYGLEPGLHPVATSLRVVGEEPGWLARTWARLRRAPSRAPVRLRWTDLADGREGYAARAVTVELPTLPPGRYLLELHVAVEDGARAATATRTLVVRER